MLVTHLHKALKSSHKTKGQPVSSVFRIHLSWIWRLLVQVEVLEWIYCIFINLGKCARGQGSCEEQRSGHWMCAAASWRNWIRQNNPQKHIYFCFMPLSVTCTWNPIEYILTDKIKIEEKQNICRTPTTGCYGNGVDWPGVVHIQIYLFCWQNTVYRIY